MAMSIEKEKKPLKAPAKKAPAKKAVASTETKAKAAAKPKVAEAPKAAAPKAGAAPKAKAAAKSAEAAGVPEAAAAVAKVAPWPTHQQIAELAHKYFAERGWKHGHHEQDWLRAERELRAR